jgi:2'-5' RNA ligase
VSRKREYKKGNQKKLVDKRIPHQTIKFSRVLSESQRKNINKIINGITII